MGDPWSTDDLRLSDPDAYPAPGQPTSGGAAPGWAGGAATPLYPAFGTTPASASPAYPAFGTIPGSAAPTFPSAMPAQDLAPWAQPSTPVPYATAVAVGEQRRATRTPRRGRLGLTAFGTVLLGTVVGGFLLYQAIASVSLISKDPLGDGLLWLTGWVGMDVIITIGLIIAVIALIRGSRRGLAGVALALGVFVTPLVFLGAVQLGADVVQERVRTQLAGTAGAAGTSVTAYADENDIDLGPFRPIFDALLDDGR